MLILPYRISEFGGYLLQLPRLLLHGRALLGEFDAKLSLAPQTGRVHCRGDRCVALLLLMLQLQLQLQFSDLGIMVLYESAALLCEFAAMLSSPLLAHLL